MELKRALSVPDPEWAVVARGLRKSFGGRPAVDGVDLKVRSGTIYGVLGPNGAGKTTTIRMLATLLKPDAGTARIFGFDAVGGAHLVRQLISVTGQYATVDESLTALENLILFSRLLGLTRAESRRRAEELLERFGLAEAAARPVKQFSGGMRRKLDLAASLLVERPLVFLDEPTTGLDPRTRMWMWEFIRGSVRKGTTVLLTTQYLDEADQLADRIAVIDRGRVVAEGTADELKASVGTSSLELTVRNGEELARARLMVEQVLGVRTHVTAEGGRITAPMSGADPLADVLAALRTGGIALAEVSVRKPTLDEVFLAFTGRRTEDEREKVEA